MSCYLRITSGKIGGDSVGYAEFNSEGGNMDDYSNGDDYYSIGDDNVAYTGSNSEEGDLDDWWTDPSTIYISNFSDFNSPGLEPFEIAPLRWKNNSKIVTSTSFEIGIPLSVINRMRDYCDSEGITELFQRLMKDPMDVNTNKVLKLNRTNWYIKRPSPEWDSNSHWLEPADENANVDYQNMLFKDDFYSILDSIGNFLGLDGIYVNNLTFMAVSYCYGDSFPHYDFNHSNGKAFVFIFHLQEAKNAPPELLVFSQYEKTKDGVKKGGVYKYNENRAIMLGDQSLHATAPCDYRETSEMRLSATVYFFDVNEDNVDGILEDFDQYYPPKESLDSDYLLKRSGIHWKKLIHDEI